MNLSPFPAPPTDNFYKFQALSGLVLLVFFFCYFSNRVDELETKEITMGNDAATLNLEFSFLQSEQTNLETNWKNLYRSVSNSQQDAIKWQDKSTNNESQRAAIAVQEQQNNQAFSNYHETSVQLEKRGHELILKGQQIKNEGKILANVATQIKGSLRYAFCIMPVLFIWTIWGFRNWYYRIQVFQDRILKVEGEKLQPNKGKRP